MYVCRGTSLAPLSGLPCLKHLIVDFKVRTLK